MAKILGDVALIVRVESNQELCLRRNQKMKKWQKWKKKIELKSDVAVNHSLAEVNWVGGARVSVKVGKGVLGCQGGDGDPLVLKNTVNVGRELGQLDGAGKDLAASSNGSRSKERGDGVIGVISGQSDSSIGTALVVGESHGDLLSVGSLDGSGGDGGNKEGADSDGRLHFE